MPVTLDNVKEVFTYHGPSAEQTEKMEVLRELQIALAKEILRLVPDCADRSAALRKLREVRMDCNAAIVLNGLV
jgi:hypothetical protein